MIFQQNVVDIGSQIKGKVLIVQHVLAAFVVIIGFLEEQRAAPDRLDQALGQILDELGLRLRNSASGAGKAEDKR